MPLGCMHGAPMAPVSGEYRGARSTRPVITQHLHQVAHAGGPTGGRLGDGPAPRQRDDVAAQPIGVLGREGGDRQAVADGTGAGRHLLDRPAAAGGLEHVGPSGVGHDEAVVVGEVALLVAAPAALPVPLEQRGDHARRPRRASTLRSSARRRRSMPVRPNACVGLAGEHGLVADGHPVLVGADLGAPHPERPAQQHGVGLARPGRSRSRCTAAASPGGVRTPRLPVEHLRLVGVAVGVLGEQHPIRLDDDHGVTHGSPPEHGFHLEA